MKSWFDGRAAALALTLALAAALPLATTSVERRDFYFFDVTLTSTAAGLTQVFWDIDRGFNDADSSVQPLRAEAEPVDYRYMIPATTLTRLQLSPVNRANVDMTLSNARIVNRRGQVIHAFHADDLKPVRNLGRFDRENSVVRITTAANELAPMIELQLPGPLPLPVGVLTRLRVVLPVALPVGLVGLLLSIPRVVGWLQSQLGGAGRWLRLRPRATIALVACTVVAVQLHPVIFLGRSFVSPANGSLMLYDRLPTLPGMKQAVYADGMGSDVGAMLFQHLYYPMAQREALLSHHELPLWNRYSLCGEPLLGQGQSMFGDPFNFLTILADSAAWAWDVRFVLARWLLAAGLGLTVWQLTRHLGAAVLVTIGSGFLGFFTFRLNHPANFGVSYAPWILWTWAGLLHAKTPRYEASWLGAWLAANIIVLASGTVKESSMLIVCLNLAGLALLFLLPAAAARRGRLLKLATVNGFIFALLTAPLWMSFLTTLRHSYTGYDHPHVGQLPLAQLLGFFDDIFYRQNHADEHVVSPAINVLFLLGIAWWIVNPKNWLHDRAGLAILATAAVPFGMAFGLVPAALIVKIPFVRNIIHVGNTFSCPLMILAIILAGCGFRDALTRLREPSWWRHASAVWLLCAGLASAYFIATIEKPKSPFFEGYAAQLAIAALALSWGAWWGLRSARLTLVAVALVIATPLLLWRHAQYGTSIFNRYIFTPGERVDIHAKSPATRLVDQHRNNPSRVIGWETCLFPSYNTALHWESLYGVDALRSRHYQELAAAFQLERIWRWELPAPKSEVVKLQRAHDLLNVKFYLAPRQEAPPTISGLELLGPRDLDVYASPSAWPRAFFTNRLAAYGSVEEFAALAQSGDGQPFAAVEAGVRNEYPLMETLASRTVRTASNYRLTSNTTSFVIDAPGPGIAVLTETFFPKDFQVAVNGKPARYFRVNHAFKGVLIPQEGHYEITFRYWPEYFTLALVLAAIGALLLVASYRWLYSSRSADA